MAANIALAAAKNPALQAAVKDVAVSAAGATMDKLVAKEREVANKMQSLKERQQQVLHALQSLQPNWPGHFLCITPIVYHDIGKAVPADRISYAKLSYGNYFFTIVLLVFNLICCIAAFASAPKDNAPEDKTPYTMHFVLGIIHLLGIPGAFLVWHFQIYKAIQPRGPLTRYGTAYLGLFVAFMFNVVMTIGVPGYGTSGIMFSFTVRDKKKSEAPFYMCLVNGLCFGGQALYFIYSWWKLRKYHNQDKLQTTV